MRVMIVALVPVSGDSIRERVPFLTRRANPSATDAEDDVVDSTVSETVMPSFCARRSSVSQVGLCSPISQRATVGSFTPWSLASAVWLV